MDSAAETDPRAAPPACLHLDTRPPTTGRFGLVEGGSPTVDADVDAGTGVTAAESVSCTTERGVAGNGSTTECIGLVTFESKQSGAHFVFDDGVVVAWTDTSLRPQGIATGERVRAEYSQTTIPICPFCGVRTSSRLKVTTVDSGTLLLLAEEGGAGPSARSQLLQTSIRAETSCAAGGSADCTLDVVNAYSDQVLETEPEQYVPYGTVTEVTTPAGTFWLSLREMHQSGRHDPNCFDGRGLEDMWSLFVVRTDWSTGASD